MILIFEEQDIEFNREFITADGTLTVIRNINDKFKNGTVCLYNNAMDIVIEDAVGYVKVLEYLNSAKNKAMPKNISAFTISRGKMNG